MNFKVNECNYKALQVWLGTDTDVYHSGSAYQSTVKLDWFMYTVGLVVLTSRYIMLSIWICTGVLEHAVLHTAVSTQTSDICDASTWVMWNSARSLESLYICLHTPLTDMTCQWCHGSYAEKVKIDERVALARPRV